MADKRISQLVDRGTVANNDVVPIVVSGATTTNKATISSIQTFMQGNLDLGVTSVGITLGSSGTDVSVSGSPITSSGNITINLPTASATNRGLLSAADWVTFNSKQDAGNYVTLDTTQTITAQKTFTTSGSSDTMIISHGSGSGFALDVLKGGNGEAIRVTKTSGSGNAMTISGGNFEAGTIVKTGGTSSQFLKADGSVDSNAYTTNTGTVTSVGLSSATSGVTIGATPVTTSGTITLAIATASGSQNGLLSSTDWTTFNNKQNALTNPVTGTGAAGQVAYWTGTNSQAGSNNLFWDNTNVKLGIGISTPEATGLTVAGGGILVSLDSGAARKVLELYATSTGAKVSSTYVGASSYGSLELLTSNEARLTIASTGAVTLTGALNGTSASFTGTVTTPFIGVTGSTGQIGNINSTNANGGYITWQTSGTTIADLGSAQQIFGAGGSDTFGINARGARSLMLGTNDTTRLTISSTGAATFSSSVNVGGTSSNTDFRIYRTVDAGAYLSISAPGGSPLTSIIGISGTNVMSLNQSGNVGIGTTSPNTKLQVEDGFISTYHNINANGAGYGIQFYTNGGGSKNTIADIGISQDGTARSGAMIFSTSNAGSPTERMRITSGGYLKASNTGSYFGSTYQSHNLVNSANGTEVLRIYHNGSSAGYGARIRYNNVAPNGTDNWFLYCDDSAALRAEIRSNGGLANYQSNNVNLSDERTKKDIEPLESYWDKFKAIEIVKFKYKDQTHDDFNIGVIAQQVESVAPEFVDVDGWNKKPELDEEGNEIVSEEEPLKSIYTADLYHATIKVLQEAMAKIEELQVQIDSLKNQMQ